MSEGGCAFISADGQLNSAAISIFSTVCRVEPALLRTCRVYSAKHNVLRLPWFNRSKGGGGIVLGKRIFFNSNWFLNDHEQHSYGRMDLYCSLRWAILLSHEIGHLPQAKYHGYDLLGRAGYLLTFSLNYLWYMIIGKRPFTDHMPLEIEADLGRKALVNLLYEHDPPHNEHPLIRCLVSNDSKAAIEWMHRNSEEIRKAQERAGSWPAYRISVGNKDLHGA